MDRLALLALYDRHERELASYPGYERQETPLVTRMMAVGPGKDFVIASRLDPAVADAAIEEEIARAEAARRDFEWKLYAHDEPPDLGSRLAARGFEVGEDEAIMALDLQSFVPTRALPEGVTVEKVEDPSGLEAVREVQAAVWAEDVGVYVEMLAARLRESPDYTTVYVARVYDTPVCSAWVDFPPGSPFASLWGGSTLPDWRGRGLYSALLSARAHEAIARGYRWLTIDAGPMSRPIAERRGFTLLTLSNPCVWKAGRAN